MGKTRGIPKTQQVEEAKRFAQTQRVEEAKRLAQTKQVEETQQLAQKKLLQARRFEGPLSIPPSIHLRVALDPAVDPPAGRSKSKRRAGSKRRSSRKRSASKKKC